MSEWNQGMIDIQDRLRAEDAWRRGDISTALGIMERNPNVGLEVRSFRNDSTVTFSIFGKDAADFLFGLAKDIASRALVAATPAQAAAHLNNLRYGPASARLATDLAHGQRGQTDASNPAVNVRGVYTLLENPTCAKFLNGVLSELDGSAGELSAGLNENYFRDYFEALDNNGAFHNAKLPDGALGGTQSAGMIEIDVSQAGRSGTVTAVEYTAIHESFHPINPISFSNASNLVSPHLAMAIAAYKVGMNQGLFKGLKNIKPLSGIGGKIDSKNSKGLIE
jgi:hypothetical protein